MLTVAHWYLEIDGRYCKDQYLPGYFYDVNLSCFTTGGTSETTVPCVGIPEEIPLL